MSDANQPWPRSLMGGLAALGGKSLFQIPSTQLDEWYYTVTITNVSTKTFDHIVLFYKRRGQNGVVALREWIVAPGDTRVFVCGVCKHLESYAFGAFEGDDMVIKFPEEGNMTPELASQIKPSDVERCADSWRIEYD